MKKERNAEYDFRLDKRDRLVVNAEGSGVSISDGEPYLLVKGGTKECFNASKTPDSVTITAKNCQMHISYPKKADIEVNMKGGGITINGMSPRKMDMTMDSSGANMSLKDLSRLTANVSSKDSGVRGSLEFLKGAAKSHINIAAVSSSVVVGIKADGKTGINTDVKNTDSLIRVPKAQKDGRIKIDVDSNDSAVFIGRRHLIPTNVASWITKA